MDGPATEVESERVNPVNAGCISAHTWVYPRRVRGNLDCIGKFITEHLSIPDSVRGTYDCGYADATPARTIPACTVEPVQPEAEL